MRAMALVVLTVGLAGFSTTPGQAQTPGDDSTLIMPPELRPATAARPAAARPAPRLSHHEKSAKQAEAQPAAASRKGVLEASHPVDFGVVVRGGSNTPRVIAPFGSSEAVQESGSAVGAGMRFGF